jgi:hypothetical protein
MDHELDLLRANKIAPCDPSSAETVAAVVPSASVSANRNSASRKRKAVSKEEAKERSVTLIIDSEDENDRRREAELKVCHRRQLARLDS